MWTRPTPRPMSTLASAMSFNPIPLRCECGGRLPARIRQVGLTPRQELLIRWVCPVCKRTHHTVKPLAECLRECPNAGDGLEVVKLTAVSMRESDAQFLHSLGVASLDEEAF